MYKALYRAYRPSVFGEVLGQEHIIKILKNQIRGGAVSHAYLFCGTRGTGKTTMARILAKGVNCTDQEERPCGICSNCKAITEGNFIDLIEIDAASNNGVENIRELRESVNFPPVVGRQKVYIIDEVHMLSTGAFNALLKTLEEPPANVMFILATTEPEKLPATILSRCMRMDFRRVSEPLLEGRMKEICKDRGIEIEDAAIRLVVSNADGSVRDGLSILDQCISGRSGKVSREDILDSLGAVGEEVYLALTGAVAEHNPAEGLMIIEQLTQGGKDTRQILQGWMSHYRNLLMTKFIKNPEDVLNMSVENIQRIREQSEMLSLTEINRAIIELSATIVQSRNSTKPRVLLEICMVKLATDISDGPVVIKQAIGQVAPVAVGGASPRAQETAAKEPSQISLQPQKAQQQMPAQQQPAKAKSAEPDDWELSMQRFNQQEIREQLEEDDFVPVFPSTGGGAGSIIGQAAQGESPKPKPTTLATPQAEPKPLATESGAETQAQNQAQNQNITGIWTAFLEDGEQTIGGMFGMVRNGAKPINITETEFIITAKGMAKAFIEKNKSKLEDMLEKYTGQRKLLKIVSETQEEEKKGIQEIAVKAEAFLGIKVDIE